MLVHHFGMYCNLRFIFQVPPWSTLGDLICRVAKEEGLRGVRPHDFESKIALFYPDDKNTATPLSYRLSYETPLLQVRSF